MKKLIFIILFPIALIAGDMDLTKTFTSSNTAAVITSAYQRISSVQWNDGNKAIIIVKVYASEAAYLAKKDPIETVSLTMDLDLNSADNFLTQAKTFISK